MQLLRHAVICKDEIVGGKREDRLAGFQTSPERERAPQWSSCECDFLTPERRSLVALLARPGGPLARRVCA